jgi:8-amino-7-oxononanoate synthase
MDISNHASLYEAVQTGYSTLKRFSHCDPSDLVRRLDKLDETKAKLLLTDGVFSMEGTLAPLREYVDIKNEFGFPMVVDDAHALGVMGANGRGTAEMLGVHDEVDIITGTFSKCFASVGGVVAGPAPVIDYIKHHGRAMIFAASMSPPALGAALKSLEIIQNEPERRHAVMDNAAYMRKELGDLGFEVSTDPTPVVALFIGDEDRAFLTWRALFDAGLFTNLAVPPGVPPGRSLIRTSYMATHTRDHLDRALEIIQHTGKQMGLI